MKSAANSSSHTTQEPVRGVMQNHRGLVSGCLLFVNLIPQGIVRTAIASPSHRGGAKGNCLVFNKNLFNEVKITTWQWEGGTSSGGGCSCPTVPALGGIHPAGGQLGLCYLHLGGQKPPRAPSLPIPAAGDSPWAPGGPLTPMFCRGKGGAGKGCCVDPHWGGDTPILHEEARQGHSTIPFFSSSVLRFVRGF